MASSLAVRRSFPAENALLATPYGATPGSSARHVGAGEAGDAPYGLPSEDALVRPTATVVACDIVNMKQIKVMAMGTFDMLHPGHLHYLKEARKCGDYLVVVVARDQTVEKERGRRPVVDEKDRLEMVKAVTLVDEAVLGNIGDKLKVVEQCKPDIICLGYDQRVDADKLKEELESRGLDVEIRRMKGYKAGKYKSSILKERGMLD